MTRTLQATIRCHVTETADLVWSVAAAHGPTLSDEALTMDVAGVPMAFDEIASGEGGRLHTVSGVPPGPFTLNYRATITERAAPTTVGALDALVFRRPSRYCDSDTLNAVAASEFAGLVGKQLVDAVSSWVGTHLAYVSGSSRPTDGAVDTYLAREGVCRDFAHLVVALLRARGVPARLASVYAPGLDPMDFHAVAEAAVDGEWRVVDATALAPRTAMVRIATGRDASDTAFLNVHAGRLEMGDVTVAAVVAPDLPADDVTRWAALG